MIFLAIVVGCLVKRLLNHSKKRKIMMKRRIPMERSEFDCKRRHLSDVENMEEDELTTDERIHLAIEHGRNVQFRRQLLAIQHGRNLHLGGQRLAIEHEADNWN